MERIKFNDDASIMIPLKKYMICTTKKAIGKGSVSIPVALSLTIIHQSWLCYLSHISGPSPVKIFPSISIIYKAAVAERKDNHPNAMPCRQGHS